MRLKSALHLFPLAFQKWREDNVSRLAAALAYYTIFSLAPVLIIVIAVAGFFLGQDTAQGEVLAQVRDLVGTEGAAAVQTMLQSASDPASGLFATLISLGLLIFAASNVFNHLRESLNLIWKVEPKSDLSLPQVVKKRLLSFCLVPALGILLLLSLGISAALSFFANIMPADQVVWLSILRTLNASIFFVITVFFFALIYKVLPDAKIDWSDVWIGAGMTAILFAIGQWAIALYLRNSSVASTYGAAGSFVVLLLWIYYSAQILFFGAEFTQIYTNRYGSQIRARRSF